MRKRSAIVNATAATVAAFAVLSAQGAAANGDLLTFGRSNATTAEQCSGGWD